jgi:hypothetical protein
MKLIKGAYVQGGKLEAVLGGLVWVGFLQTFNFVLHEDVVEGGLALLLGS